MNLVIYLQSIKVSLIRPSANIDKDIGELRNDFKNFEADLAISRPVNTKLRDRIISLERQCWSNSQYSRLQCLEITGLPGNINNENLEEKALMSFEKNTSLSDQNKRFIIKLSKRKDANKI